MNVFDRHNYLIIAAFFCGLLPAGCSMSWHSSVRPHHLVMPYEYGGEWDAEELDEPSGAVYCGERESIFVVGDEGHLCELNLEGEILRIERLRPGDFEGITLDTSTGLLYLAEEGEEKILEVDPDLFEIIREFQVPRSFQGKVVFKEGGNGIEGITFVPDPDHREGGTFYVSNQSFSLEPGDEKSRLVELTVPLKSGTDNGGTARILRVFAPGVIDISSLHYSIETDTLFFTSDASNTFYEIDRNWNFLRARAFPGANQEGLALDGKGTMYIAQDSGGILVIKPHWLTQKK